ncbi:MAG: iron-sulfur cluster assembly protein [Pseudomonadota bacterium]
MDLHNRIIENLKKVKDPETTIDVVNMRLIKDLEVTEDGKVSFKFRPSSSVCPLVFPLILKIHETIKETEGVKELKIVVVDHQKADELNNLLKTF